MSDIYDPRRGYFPTGGSTPAASRLPLSFGSSVPTSNAKPTTVPLGFGSGVPKSSGGFAEFFGFGSTGLSFGEPVAAMGQPVSGGTPGIVRGDVDGSAPWQSLLAGVSAGLLESIGGQRDAPAPQLQQASMSDRFTGAAHRLC